MFEGKLLSGYVANSSNYKMNFSPIVHLGNFNDTGSVENALSDQFKLKIRDRGERVMKGIVKAGFSYALYESRDIYIFKKKMGTVMIYKGRKSVSFPL